MLKIITVFCGIIFLIMYLSRNKTFNLSDTDARMYMATLSNNLFQGNNESNIQLEYKHGHVDETLNLTNDNSHHSKQISKHRSQQESNVVSDSRTVSTPGSQMKTILFWNECHNSYDYGIGLGSETLARHGCPVHQCTFTADKSQIETADAVVIHGLLPDLPTYRTENQIYVFHFFESPLRTTSRLSLLPKWQDVFNLTFTYMYDEETDIPASHGRVVRLPEPNPNAVPKLDEVRSKPKLVLWIVSNCRAYSGRMEYAKQLAQYVPVDIVGDCGNISCPLPKSSRTCIRQMAKDYMFYLAFENSYCEDYYTEKVINPLALGMVPITMGATNYSRFFPPDSYIDTRDFSPRQLAKKLLHLKEHVSEYMEYFKWRREYKLSGSLRPQGFCRLCEILHTVDYPYKSSFSMAQYWSAEKLCITKSEHLEQLGIS